MRILDISILASVCSMGKAQGSKLIRKSESLKINYFGAILPTTNLILGALDSVLK